jgi:hypothetical protein
MTKGEALVFVVVATIAVVGPGIVLAFRGVQGVVSRWVWARAKVRARWERHTDEGVDCEPDGTPIARVTVQLVARAFGRVRVLDTKPVGTVAVQYPGDPALLELEALADNRAETRNTSLRGEYQ